MSDKLLEEKIANKLFTLFMHLALIRSHAIRFEKNYLKACAKIKLYNAL